jgi:hypothetical protein
MSMVSFAAFIAGFDDVTMMRETDQASSHRVKRELPNAESCAKGIRRLRLAQRQMPLGACRPLLHCEGLASAGKRVHRLAQDHHDADIAVRQLAPSGRSVGATRKPVRIF